MHIATVIPIMVFMGSAPLSQEPVSDHNVSHLGLSLIHLPPLCLHSTDISEEVRPVGLWAVPHSGPSCPA